MTQTRRTAAHTVFRCGPDGPEAVDGTVVAVQAAAAELFSTLSLDALASVLTDAATDLQQLGDRFADELLQRMTDNR